MLSFEAGSSGKAWYYLSYLKETGKLTIETIGGLSREVGYLTNKGFKRAVRGYHPSSGTKCRQNAGKNSGRALWDCTFSLPKSVSCLMAALPPEQQAELWDCIREAVIEAFQILEDKAYCRIGPKGNEPAPAEILGAIFPHWEARAADEDELPDVCLHVHAIVPNLGRTEDGNFRAVDCRSFLPWKLCIGAAFRLAVATKIEERMGIRTEQEETGTLKKFLSFRIPGVPKSFVKSESKRRDQIEAEGYSSAKQSNTVALATRKKKKRIPLEKLKRHWQYEAKKHGLTERRALAILGKTTRRDPSAHLQDVIAKALDRAIETPDGTFREQDLFYCAYEFAQSTGLSIAEVKAAVAEVLDEKKELSQVSRDRYTTEAATTAKAVVMKRRGERLTRRPPAARRAAGRLVQRIAATRQERAVIAEAKRRRVSFVATDSVDAKEIAQLTAEALAVEGLKVRAVTRKKVDKEKLQGRGVKAVTHAAFSHWIAQLKPIQKAKNNLKPRGFVRSLWRPKPFAALRVRVTNQRAVPPVDDRTVLFVTDAHLLSPRELEEITEAAAKGGGRVVFAGDTETRSTFSELCEEALFTRLTPQKERSQTHVLEKERRRSPGPETYPTP